jgi:hypothetical protein
MCIYVTSAVRFRDLGSIYTVYKLYIYMFVFTLLMAFRPKHVVEHSIITYVYIYIIFVFTLLVAF